MIYVTVPLALPARPPMVRICRGRSKLRPGHRLSRAYARPAFACVKPLLWERGRLLLEQRVKVLGANGHSYKYRAPTGYASGLYQK